MNVTELKISFSNGGKFFIKPKKNEVVKDLCLNVTIRNGYMYSTNGVQAGRSKCNLPDMTLSGFELEYVLKVAKPGEVLIDDGSLLFPGGERVAMLPKDNYTAFDWLDTMKLHKAVTVNKKELLAALKTASVIALGHLCGETRPEVGIVRLRTIDGRLEVESRSDTLGSSRVYIPCDGELFPHALNVKKFIEIVKSAPETLTIWVREPGRLSNTIRIGNDHFISPFTFENPQEYYKQYESKPAIEPEPINPEVFAVKVEPAKVRKVRTPQVEPVKYSLPVKPVKVEYDQKSDADLIASILGFSIVTA